MDTSRGRQRSHIKYGSLDTTDPDSDSDSDKEKVMTSEKEADSVPAVDTTGTEVSWWRTISLYNVYVLILLLVTYLLNQLDRYMLAITTKSIAQELHYGEKSCMVNTSFSESVAKSAKCSDVKTIENCTWATNNEDERVCKWDYDGQGLQYQVIAGPVFIVIYTFSGIFIGFLADKYNRKILLAICLIFWSTMTILTGFVQEYWQLVVLRFALGFGEAGCTPFAASILTDYFTLETRGLALGIYNWGIYMGYSLAYAFGNFISLANINGQGWRWSFFLSGAPGILIGILILLTLKEPERKRSDSNAPKKLEANAKVPEQMDFVTKTKRVLKKFFNPSLLLICLAGSIRNASGYVFSYNTQPYFTSIGQTKEQIGQWLSWIPLVGGSFSVLVGGFISDRVVKKFGLYSRIIVIFVSLLIAAPFAAGTLFFDPPAAYAFQIPTYIFGEMWIGITLAVIVELVPLDIRTSAIALYLFIITNIGGNIQLIVPSIKESFINAGYSKSDALRNALYILYPGPYVYGAVVYILSMFVIKRDQKRAQKADSSYLQMEESASD